MLCVCVLFLCVFVCLHNFLLITVFPKDGEKDVLVLYGCTDGKNIGREERKETVIRICYIKLLSIKLLIYVYVCKVLFQ